MQKTRQNLYFIWALRTLFLHIKTITSELSGQQQRELEGIISEIKIIPETLESEGYILLDGIEYELTIKIKDVDKNFKWKIATEDLQYLTPLIDFVRYKLTK
jgi:hypothetical protein